MFPIVDPPWNKIKSLKNTYDRVIWRSPTLLLISSITGIFQGFIIKSSYFSLYAQNWRVVYFMKWLLPYKSLEIRLSFYRPFSVCISYVEHYTIKSLWMHRILQNFVVSLWEVASSSAVSLQWSDLIQFSFCCCKLLAPSENWCESIGHPVETIMDEWILWQNEWREPVTLNQG